MRPRIVHVASGREWRGGQNQAYLLARRLAEQGVAQVVVTGRGTLLAKRLRHDGIPVRECGWDMGIDPRAAWAAWDEARRGPSILHAHDGHATTLAAVAGGIAGRPFVTTRRVDFHLRSPGTWRRAARVIAISRAVRDILLADGIATDRLRVVHSGIDLAAVRHRGAAPDPRPALGLPVDRPLLLNVAALADHKDQLTLVEAAAALRARHPAALWVIAGEGPERPALEARIASLGLGATVRLLGQVPDPMPLIRHCTLFVMSSKEEGLGTTVLDAMAIGAPVVATRAGGIPEMLEGGAGTLVPIRDPAALADGVATLLADPARAAAQVRTATAGVEGFSDAAMARGVLSVYDEVSSNVQRP
jgi:glycosyltransferase involved in cell wall biosynthesis